MSNPQQLCPPPSAQLPGCIISHLDDFSIMLLPPATVSFHDEMNCGCVPAPPEFDLPPPPDASFVWQLLSGEPFQKAPDCEWGPFVSLTDVSSGNGISISPKALIGVATLAVLLLVALLVTLIFKLRRRSTNHKSKTTSSDAILTCGDNVWTYNSMKTTNSNVQIYDCGSNPNVNRLFSQATPATMRSYVSNYPEPTAMRHSASTTLRLHPRENRAAYHTVVPPTEHYEEIPARGTLPPFFHVPPPPINSPKFGDGRMSIRKPPPTCRPPPPPQRQILSPTGSDASVERELQRLPVDSPPFKKYEEGGRESGYGTAPSRQWRSSPGSAGREEEGRITVCPVIHPTQSMTYV